MREVHYSNKPIGTTATLIPGNSDYPRIISAPKEIWVGGGSVTPATGEAVAAGELYVIPAGVVKYGVGRVEVIADIREIRYDPELDARVAAALAESGAASGVSLFSAEQTENAQTGTTYTYVASDAGKVVTHENAAAISVTVPANVFSAGQRIDGWVLGAGMVTLVAGAGMTLLPEAGLSLITRAQRSAFTVWFRSATTAFVTGSLAAS